MSTKCVSQIKLKNGAVVPCGSCVPCCKRYASGWSFRLMNEEKHSETAYFVTLTYATDKVEYTKNGFKTLHGPHLQGFFKSLRKVETKKLKYFAVGEYGGKTKRPHYHAIIFNATIRNLVDYATERAVKTGLIELDGQTEMQCKHWKHGHITIGRVTEASVGYALKYMLKKKHEKKYDRDDRIKEFSRMSKGLGSKYVSEGTIRYHRASIVERFCMKLPDGKLSPMPRYYKKYFYTPEERQIVGEHFENQAYEEYNKMSYEQKEKYDREKGESERRDARKIPYNRETI